MSKWFKTSSIFCLSPKHDGLYDCTMAVNRKSVDIPGKIVSIWVDDFYQFPQPIGGGGHSIFRYDSFRADFYQSGFAFNLHSEDEKPLVCKEVLGKDDTKWLRCFISSDVFSISRRKNVE